MKVKHPYPYSHLQVRDLSMNQLEYRKSGREKKKYSYIRFDFQSVQESNLFGMNMRCDDFIFRRRIHTWKEKKTAKHIIRAELEPNLVFT